MHAAESEALRRDLSALLGARHVSVRAPERVVYGHGCWPVEQLWNRSGEVRYQPDVIAWPGSTEDVRRLVAYARERHVPLTPYGGGTSVVGGVLPMRAGITVDLKRLHRVISVDLAARRAVAQAGIVGQKLFERLDASGAALGHVPGSLWSSTLGGWIATRSAGQLSSRYGKIEDMVLGLTAVTGAGEVITTGPERSPGPDLVQLLCGSEGTLALVTQAVLAIHPKPARQAMKAFALRGLEPSLAAVRRLYQAGLRPALVRLSDPLDAALSELGDDRASTLPGVLRSALGTLGSRSLGLALSAPATLNRAADLLPPRWTLLLAFEAHQSVALEEELREATDLVREAGGTDLGESPVRGWYRKRFSQGYRWPAIFRGGAWADALDVACTWDRARAVYDAVRRATSHEALVFVRFAHTYLEGTAIQFTFLGPALQPANGEASMERTLRAAARAALSLGATVSHHHGVGVARSRFLPDELGDSGMRLMRSLKSAFDPDGILNPGKLVT